MAIYRGEGGPGDATTDSTTQALAATQAAADALVSKNAAAASASSASDSATSATNSATTATAQAAIATTKAGEALTSATNAATSAGTATTKASEALTSANNAAASAASASTNVDNAFNAITSTATTLSPGASATSSFNTTTKQLTLGIPRGDTGPQGIQGVAGPTGATGATGAGVIAGGTTNQVLAKASNTDYDTAWKDTTGTGSVVLSDSPTITGYANLPLSQFNATSTFIGVNDGENNNSVQIGSGSLNGYTNIGIGANSDGDYYSTYTNINGSVSFTNPNSYTQFIGGGEFGNVLSSTSTLRATGALQLTGSATGTHSFATNQTTAILNIGGASATGALNIGGTSATGVIALGRSTGTQTVNIATGVVGSGRTKTVNIGTGINSVGSTVVNIGQLITGTSNGDLTVAIGRQTRSAGTTTIGIGDGSVSGTGTININIGTATSTTTIAGNVIFYNLTLPVNVRQNTQIVGDLLALTVGTRAFVTDALSPIFGMPVSGGGSTPVPVYFDGTTWRVG